MDFNPDSLAKAIHYPECWDTTAYPSFADALAEVTASFQCSEQPCAQAVAAEQGAQTVLNSWANQLHDIATTLEADGDEWHCAANIRTMLKDLPIPQASPQPTPWDAEWLAKRLARVAALAGVTMPSMSHQQTAEAALTILGDIARKLEQAGRTPLAPMQAYVQVVPDHCDRIVWQGQYYHLASGQSPAIESVEESL